ncbi:MAG TPA: CRISPR-associated helicase Cas3' [Thermoplasmatales archaeon]|nr:CRISPR-associated helicase Cas3' [Thermoplasmatales archaeon]
MSMFHFFKLKSHKNDTDYKILYRHLKNVGEISKKIILGKKIKNQKLFAEIAYLIGISHDFAKATTYFQEYLEKGKKTKKAYHGKLSSIFGYFLVKKYLEWKNIPNDIALIAWLVITKHHSDIMDLMGTQGELDELDEIEVEKEQIRDIKQNHLDEIEAIYKDLSPIEINLEEFFDEFDDICKEIKEKGEELVMEGKLKNYFFVLFFYSVLLDADKLDASDTGESVLRRRWKNIPSDLVDRYKKIKFGKPIANIDILRDKAYNEVISNLKHIDLEMDRIFSIELPTGCGKTLTAFSFALKLREIIKDKQNFIPRIIYSLPFLSIIEQNAEVLAEVLAEQAGILWEKLFRMGKKEVMEKLEYAIPSDLLLKHHHLIDIRYRTQNEDLERDVWKSLLLIEGWHSEIIITTFIQFFHSLITNRNRAARKFHNMINSIIILDEVQSIPYEYWLLIRESLKYLAYEYNCWIILITATQPFIFRENEIKPLIKDKEKYFKEFKRSKYVIELKEKSFEDFKNEILRQILNNENKDIMVVVNTIDSSKELYKFLRKELEKEYGKSKVGEEGIAEFKQTMLVNLSTHILPFHRLERIKKIKTEKNKRKIIITTQLIEAGVDISVDIIYRDLAPLDCVIQTGGRCNRNNEKREKGICKIVNLIDENNKNKRFSRIYDSTLIGATTDILEQILIKKGKIIEEKDFVGLVTSYFERILERGSNDPSKDKINAMRWLKFSEIAEFKLIKEEYQKIDVFVEIDDNAKKIWKEYKKIKEIENRLKRREELLRMKKEFYNYIISVDKKKAEKSLVEPYLGYVTKEGYDIETGYRYLKDNALII